MALFFECMQQCAQKYLTRADIVRDAMLQQQGPSLFLGHALRAAFSPRRADYGLISNTEPKVLMLPSPAVSPYRFPFASKIRPPPTGLAPG
jgi:hypothetical protein